MSEKSKTVSQEQAKQGTIDLQDLDEQVRVRFEKLHRLREREKVPFKNGFEPKDLAWAAATRRWKKLRS